MKGLKKGLAIALAAAMVVTMVPSNADAAKKVKLSKTKASIEAGKTLKLSVKNAKKSAKVTWKSSKVSVAKVAKKTTKGNAANTIKGVKKGTALITATVKVGKKKKNLKCKVTVNNKKATATTAPVATATAAPVATATTAPAATTAATATPKPTKGPSATPKPTQAPTPTPMPEGGANDFDKVADTAIKLDNSTYVTNDGCGTGKYDEKLDRIEINDMSAEALSQGSWAMPENVTVNVEDELTFRVQGYFLGTETFRFWIGTAGSGGCTPVALVNEVADGAGVREDIGYPCELDADGKVLNPDNRGDATDKVTANQIALNANKEKNGAFDVTFTLKAGISQFDTKNEENPFSRFTLKGIHGSYINGLVVKNVYITEINGKAASEGSANDKEEAPYTYLDLSEGNYAIKGTGTAVTGDAVTVTDSAVTVTDSAVTVSASSLDVTGDFEGVFVKLPEEFADGEEFEVCLEFEAEGTMPRIYGVKGQADSALTNIVGPATTNTLKGKVTAKADATDKADWIFIKKESYASANFTSLKIKSIGVRKVAK